MHKQIFVNLPIKDMARSTAFFKSLGLGFDPHFTNDQGACLVIGENIYAMLLVEAFYKTFTAKAIADATRTSELLLALTCESRAEVDALVAKAVAAGATTPRAPQDHGFMYGHGFDDLDGHSWELFYMEAHAAEQVAADNAAKAAAR
ncbi:MAG TPA: VOC family protein [Ideonella sp.]|nr:VOC family protein [Ideonella sp.]